MAVTQTKQDNLVDSKIVDKDTSSLDPNSQEPQQSNSGNSEQPKKAGFFKTTWWELKKVNWPNFSYVVKWSITVIIFAAVFSLFLSFFDHIFNTGLEYLNCTSPEGGSQDVSTCNQEFFDNLLLR
jgi:preprotein translocase SecE subunit